MPWILAGGGVVVVAVVVVLIIVLTGGSDTSSPQGVAQAAVDGINNKDTNALNDITCAGQKGPGSIDEGMPAGLEIKAELGEVKKTSDTEATANVKISISGAAADKLPGPKSATVPLKLNNKDGKWCVSGTGSPTT